MTNSGSDAIRMRAAEADEAAALSALAMRSKAHWGYSREFMDACRAELSYSSEDFLNAKTRVVVATCSDNVAGFYVLKKIQPALFELEAMFVEPERMGAGVGQALMRDALEAVATAGGGRLRIQSDPNAAAFYRAMGAVETGRQESMSIPGRFLPLFEIQVSAEVTQLPK